VSQCAYCYSSNRKATQPFSSLLYTSLNGRTKARLDTLGTYQNWRGIEWWEEGYEELWAETAPPTHQDATDTIHTGTNSADENASSSLPYTTTYTCPVTKSQKPRTTSAKDKVVYLTADSDFELSELDPTETYIIGGIVDKNRYKVPCTTLPQESFRFANDKGYGSYQALCANKAQGQGIRTARLPIGVYLKELPTRKVLTVNQVRPSNPLSISDALYTRTFHTYTLINFVDQYTWN
jgi:tRNA (guanine9-N1)-methyltransferase